MWLFNVSVQCMAVDHTRHKCLVLGPIDRTGFCFNCEEDEHRLNTCRSRPTCSVCKEKVRPFNHRADSDDCPPY